MTSMDLDSMQSELQRLIVQNRDMKNELAEHSSNFERECFKDDHEKVVL